MSKVVVAKYTVNGERFEIFVDSDRAYEFITGKRKDAFSVLESEEIFEDANKGKRQSQDKLKKAFETIDTIKIAEIILKKGDVPITTEQRNKLLEEKRKQIIDIIARNSIDPRTKAPHTVQRIDAALHEAKIAIDPFKNANSEGRGRHSSRVCKQMLQPPKTIWPKIRGMASGRLLKGEA
ncbi:ribosome assembly factor SBDS [Candidatus Marsarchaeota archaeon]|nr:ribosome assembly factor SBDS [Candidatus Marsarchaeota archaeon]